MSSIHVNIGEVKTARRGCLKATLGSCVGIGIFHPESNVYGLAHVLLPRELGEGSPGGDAREAGAAVQALLRKLRIEKSEARHLRAVIAGGAHMFPGNRRLHDVGRENVEAVTSLLKDLRIKVLARDVLGSQARSITIDADSGRARSWFVTESERGRPVRYNLDLEFTSAGEVCNVL